MYSFGKREGDKEGGREKGREGSYMGCSSDLHISRPAMCAPTRCIFKPPIDVSDCLSNREKEERTIRYEYHRSSNTKYQLYIFLANTVVPRAI